MFLIVTVGDTSVNVHYFSFHCMCRDVLHEDVRMCSVGTFLRLHERIEQTYPARVRITDQAFEEFICCRAKLPV